MDHVEAANPYQAPEASIAALRAEIRCPPVYKVTSLLCWGLGAFHLAGSLLVIGVLIRRGLQEGWDHVLIPGDEPLTLLIIALGLLGTVSYLVAGQWLRDNRGRPGLILCGVGMALTYSIIWLAGRS